MDRLLLLAQSEFSKYVKTKKLNAALATGQIGEIYGFQVIYAPKVIRTIFAKQLHISPYSKRAKELEVLWRRAKYDNAAVAPFIEAWDQASRVNKRAKRA